MGPPPRRLYQDVRTSSSPSSPAPAGDALSGLHSHSKPWRLRSSASYLTTAGLISLHVSPSEAKEELRMTNSAAPSTGRVAVIILPIYKHWFSLGGGFA